MRIALVACAVPFLVAASPLEIDASTNYQAGGTEEVQEKPDLGELKARLAKLKAAMAAKRNAEALAQTLEPQFRTPNYARQQKIAALGITPEGEVFELEFPLRSDSRSQKSRNSPKCDIRASQAGNDKHGLRLDRAPASPQEPFAMYAVDRTEDGCAVMVPMNYPDNVQPLPEIVDGPLLHRIPAKTDQ